MPNVLMSQGNNYSQSRSVCFDIHFSYEETKKLLKLDSIQAKFSQFFSSYCDP